VDLGELVAQVTHQGLRHGQADRGHRKPPCTGLFAPAIVQKFYFIFLMVAILIAIHDDRARSGTHPYPLRRCLPVTVGISGEPFLSSCSRAASATAMVCVRHIGAAS